MTKTGCTWQVRITMPGPYIVTEVIPGGAY
jgi:hypothetical protein